MTAGVLYRAVFFMKVGCQLIICKGRKTATFVVVVVELPQAPEDDPQKR